MKQNELFLYSLLKHPWFESSEKLQITVCEEWDESLDLATKYTLWKANDFSPENAAVVSIFSSVIMNEKKGKLYEYPVEIMSIEQEAVYPENHTNPTGKRARKHLVEQLEKLSNLNASQVYFLLQKQAWSITNNQGGPTLSLFEFLKTRAAFAQCLVQQENDKHPFLMLCGDISGIQSFIYDIHSNKAAKSIKGRSFYLQLLLDSIIHRFITACNVTIANVIYSSGGKFYMLLPNTTAIKTQISRIETEVMNYVFDKHQERLFVCLGYVSFGLKVNDNEKIVICDEKTDEGELITDFSELWKAVSNKAALKKGQKNRELLIDKTKFDYFFRGELVETYNGEGVQICAVTGIPTTKAVVLNEKDKPKEEDKIYVTKAVEEQVKLGEQLAKATYYTIQLGYNGPFDPFKICRLSDKKNSGTFCYQLNPCFTDNDVHVSRGMLFYGGNEQALIQREREDKSSEWRLKTYEELAKPDKGKLNKLAVLRMDVDDLSQLFTQSMKGLGCSLTAYSFMSSMMNWFFAGHLNALRIPYKDHLNIQYAGGDDLFVVGRWKEVLEFAKDIRSHFEDFVGSSTMLTLSAGLIMVNPKFPISKAADLAEEALDKAKAYQHKNAFCIGSQVVQWGKDFDFVWALKDLMIHSLEDLGISKGLLYKLLVYKEQQKQGLIDWRWQSAYMFQKYQNYAQSKKKLVAKKLLQALKEGLFTGRFQHEYTDNEATKLVAYNIGCQLKDDISLSHKMLDLYCLAAKLTDYYLR